SRAMNHLRAFRTLSNFAWTISEAAIYKLNREEFAYQITGAQWLDQLAAAQGAIVLTAHMGNYDLGAALFAQKCNREIRMLRALGVPQLRDHRARTDYRGPERPGPGRRHRRSGREMVRGSARTAHGTLGPMVRLHSSFFVR